MLFFCPELEKSDSFNPIMIETNTNAETLNTVDGNINKIFQTQIFNGVATNKAFLYGNRPTINKYLGGITKQTEPITIAELATLLGISIITNFTDTNDYYWQFQNLYELKSNMFYTVLTDNGMQLLTPQRRTTSRQIPINQDNIISLVNISDDLSVGYAGDTADITIAVNQSVVYPATVTSTQKKYCIDKYYSKTNIITITTPYNAAPLDYISINGGIYLAMSKKNIAEYGQMPLYQITCVKEINGSYTHGAGNITVDLPIVSAGALTAGKTVKVDANGKVTTADYTRSYGYAEGAATTLASSGFTKIKLESSVANGGDISWDSTNKRFYANKAGVYTISTGLRFNGGATGGGLQLFLYINGTLARILGADWLGVAGKPIGVCGTVTLALAQNAYVEIYAQNDSLGSGCAIDTTSGYSWLAVEKVIYN